MMVRKKFVSIVLVFTCLAATFQFLVPYLSYYSNYTYFSTVACINKNHPEMHCNGTCQLKKMIKHEHHHAGQNGKTTINSSNRIDFFFLQHQAVLSHLQPHTQALVSFNESIHSLFFGEPLPHPPQMG